MKKILILITVIIIFSSLLVGCYTEILEKKTTISQPKQHTVHKRVVETDIKPRNLKIATVIKNEKWEPPFDVPNAAEDVIVDVGLILDYDSTDTELDLIVYCADFEDPFTHILNLYRSYPELKSDFINMGRYLTENNLDTILAPSNSGFREIPDVTEKAREMADAYKVIYNSFRINGWIGPYRGCWNSPFYGKGLKYAEYLFRRGRAWENWLATLEFESTFGLGGTCYYGILYKDYSNTVEDYCNLLDDHNVSNDPNEQAWFWNDPGCPRYADNMVKFVNTVRNWYP